MPREYKHISQYEKEILGLKKQGLTKREIGEKLGFSMDQVHNFITRYNRKQRMIEAGKSIHKRGRPCEKDNELPPSIQKLDKLAQMRYEIASKVYQKIRNGKRIDEGFSIAHRKEVRTSVKFMVIYRHKEKYSISEMCNFLHISRSGYYDYVKRIDIPSKDLPLAEKIRECQDKYGKTYGYRRVHMWLERQGIYRNPKTVLRVMQKYNLLSEVRRKRYRNYGDYLHRYPNLLNRDFKADRPNQKWVTDISYIKTQQGTLYLSVIRDLYDNSIVAYKTGTEQNVNLVLSTIRAARRKEKVTAELQLHSDQGFQYTSHPYFKLTQSYGITPSMSRRGNPYDNAMAENFFSILKTECIYRTKLRTYEDARILISEYIHFYNNERIQLKTKLTPLEKRNQFVA